ncbi:uncharacterized protein SPPG_09299 [Spizellomyces punctatus DAOM BR117]|uniref:Uncharacterized protein n=1 Tax=Spizellomyces punctatus (strain DAOM BR117) TaxID=645134 RepID=A0A0L0HCN9_SPIPD|nr:uncharacterized protein SPPG_09299 [Spizellomyces punctatus DAOM BR117]KNC98736.1 hypothetical protein SPPG_09299 [Spizellomyces punctatus DAOM BR117]|eukprot:XP_016606776.1 hypothetical protein SPPG_09299 [Spizellomyces punctatus DAOM BR117]
MLELSGPGYEDIVTRTIGARVILLMYVDDVELFDDIVAWKEERGDRVGLEDALGHFAQRPHADALTRIVFANSSTHWDAF